MKQMKKSIILFGAVAIALLMVSSVTAVPKVNSEPLNDYIKNSQSNDYDVDWDELEDILIYMGEFFNGENSEFGDFYENSDKVLALENSLTVLIDEMFDTCGVYLQYLEDGIWTEEEFMETAGNYIANNFIEFFQTDQTIVDLLNDDYIAYLQDQFQEGVNETVDLSATISEESAVGNVNLLEVFSNSVGTTGMGSNGVLEGLSIEEIISGIEQPLDGDLAICPIAVFLCSILFACCLWAFGADGEIAQICTYIICLVIVAGPCLVWDYGAVTILITLGVFLVGIALFKDFLAAAFEEDHGRLGLVIVTIVVTVVVLCIPLLLVAILLLALIVVITNFGTGWYMEMMDEQVMMAYQLALAWYNSW